MAKTISRRQMLSLSAATVGGATAWAGGAQAHPRQYQPAARSQPARQGNRPYWAQTYSGGPNLRAREQQIQAAVAYIETLLDYWLARTDLGQLLSGRLPSPGGSAMARMGRPTTTAESAGH